jgi:hypothetical protein
MRRGIATTLSAAAVTSAVIVIAGAAAPSYAGTRGAPPGKAHAAQPLPVTASFSYAGYEASGRDFRYVSALISVPNQPQDSQYPQAYVQLSAGSLGTGDNYARAGIETCLVAENLDPDFTCPGGVEWVGFVETFVNTTTPEFQHFVPLNATQGDGIDFSIYYSQHGNGVYFTITAPSCGSGGLTAQSQCVLQFQANVAGPIYDHAAGLVDYTNSSGTPIPLPPSTQQFRLTQFQQGALTTLRGDRGSWTGPWTTTQIEATSNGQPAPEGTVEASPSYLWTDGAVANGAARQNDAFGVWRRA